MLNTPELYNVLKFFKLFCIAGLLPTKINLQIWEFEKLGMKKKCICIVSYGLFVLHSLYKIGGLVYTFLFVPDVPLHQLMIRTILAIASAVYGFWYYAAYISDPALFATYFRTTIRGNAGGTADLRNQLKTQRTRKMAEYSLQDLMAITLPYLILLGLLVVYIAIIYDPSLRLIIYTALPRQLQTRTTFILCLLEELRFLVILVSIVTPLWQLQVISFELVNSQLRHVTRMIKTTRLGSTSVYRKLRTLQLYVSLLNNFNSYMIFTWKQLSIITSIMCGYAAIAHFRDYPVFGIMYYVIWFDSTLVYTCMYETAFKIPQLFQQVSTCALLHVRGNRPEVFRRQIRSIPPTEIRVGQFHKMERGSTMRFLDFVVVNIVNMLVAYG